MLKYRKPAKKDSFLSEEKMGKAESIVDLEERLGYLRDLHPVVQLAEIARRLAWQKRIQFDHDDLVFCASPSEDGREVGLLLGYPTESGKFLTSGKFIFDGGLRFCSGDGSPEQLLTAVKVFLDRIKGWHESLDETL